MATLREKLLETFKTALKQRDIKKLSNTVDLCRAAGYTYDQLRTEAASVGFSAEKFEDAMAMCDEEDAESERMIRSRFSIHIEDSPQEVTRIAELLRSSGDFFDILAGINYVHATVDFHDHECVNDKLRAIGIEQRKVFVYLQRKRENENENAHFKSS